MNGSFGYHDGRELRAGAPRPPARALRAGGHAGMAQRAAHEASLAPDGPPVADRDERQAALVARSLLAAVDPSPGLARRLRAAVREATRARLRAVAFATPLGWYAVAYTDAAVVRVLGPRASAEACYAELRATYGELTVQEITRDDVGGRTACKLAEYHAGRRVQFDEPLDLDRVTPFTRDVLLATARIPYGQVRPYAWVARESGHPRAVRAVGQALHVNPWAPMIPCHRVVASGGGLGGYAKGPEMKRWYLRLEGYPA